MESPQGASRIIRFGSFQANLVAGELRRNGTRVRLQEQPFQILVLLLERAGEVVSREELQQKLWAADTFVDFDNGLNIAVKKLRVALGDDAETPRYIETLPRRGYRFIARVAADMPGFLSSSSHDRAPLVLVPKHQEPITSAPAADTIPEAPPATTPTLQPARPSHWLRYASVAAVVLAAIATAAYFYWHRSPVLTEKDTLVLADFTNATGDPVFDGALRQGLEVQLGQSPFLNILSDRSVVQTLTMMGQPLSKDTRLTPELAREVCQRTGSAATLEGTISTLGSQYVLGLRAVDCRSGNTLTDEQVTAGSKEQVIKALGEAATKTRLKLGESLPSLQKFNVSLDSATTPSLDALQACTLGFQAKEN